MKIEIKIDDIDVDMSDIDGDEIVQDLLDKIVYKLGCHLDPAFNGYYSVMRDSY
tara:strand:+ start:497 stop:658 length:162 start_codon:yes stop_codon:yes gene_type:complete